MKKLIIIGMLIVNLFGATDAEQRERNDFYYDKIQPVFMQSCGNALKENGDMWVSEFCTCILERATAPYITPPINNLKFS